MSRLKLIAELAKKRRRADRLAAGVELRELDQDVAGAARPPLEREPSYDQELDFT